LAPSYIQTRVQGISHKQGKAGIYVHHLPRLMRLIRLIRLMCLLGHYQ
jgi:hypothetical protein